MKLKNLLRNNYHQLRKILQHAQINESRADLKKFHNIHSGKSAIIIGNGPSVKIEDFAKFNNLISFACNRFQLCYEQTAFRPNYTICIDPQMIKDFGTEIATNSGGELFIADHKTAQKFNHVHYIYRHRSNPFIFSEDISNFVSNGSSVICAALQIAYYMGIKKIYLYGLDHNFNYQSTTDNLGKLKASGDNNHFIQNYRSGKNWLPPKLIEIEEAFQICADFFKEKGIEIYNVSHQTKLEIFPKKKLKDIL